MDIDEVSFICHNLLSDGGNVHGNWEIEQSKHARKSVIAKV